MTDTDLYNARDQLADVAKWLGWQDECLAFGLVNSYDALRLYDYAQAHPDQAKRITDMLAATSPQGYAANCAAVRDADFREQLGAIKVPTLVIAGSDDAVTPPSGGRFIEQHVAGAEYAEFYAAHLSNVQAGDAFSARVVEFLLA